MSFVALFFAFFITASVGISLFFQTAASSLDHIFLHKPRKFIEAWNPSCVFHKNQIFVSRNHNENTRISWMSADLSNLSTINFFDSNITALPYFDIPYTDGKNI